MSVVTRVQRYEYSNGTGPYLSMNGGEKPDDAPRRSYYLSDEYMEGAQADDEWLAEWQPQPGEDDMGEQWQSSCQWDGQKFGFASSHERRSWFSLRSHRWLCAKGIELVEYTLLLESAEQLTLGGHQLAFDPDAVIERKVLK